MGRQDLLEGIVAVGGVEGNLIIAGRYAAFVREHPDLEEFDILVTVFIVFAVADTCSGTHHLDIAVFDDGGVAHAVLVFEIAFQRNTNDLHIVVRMRSEAHSRRNNIVIQDAQHAKVHAFRIVIISETERVVAVEPTVVGMSAGICRMKNGIGHNC